MLKRFTMGRRKKKNNYTELGDDDDDYAPPRHAIKKQNRRLNGPNLRNGRNRNKKVNDDDGFRKQLEGEWLLNRYWARSNSQKIKVSCLS